MKTLTLIAAAALTAAAVHAGPPAPLEPAPAPAPAEDGWHVRVAPYAWLQGLEGTTGVRGLTADADISFSDIFDDLEYSLMGVIEVTNGDWGFFADINFSELQHNFYRGGNLLDSGELDMQQLVSNVGVSRRLLHDGPLSLTGYAGARINWIDLEITLAGGKGGQITGSGDELWADAIVGLRLQYDLNERWFLRFTGDIGAGDSDFTWQAMGLVGYRLNESWNLGIGYRGLGTDYADDGFTYDMTAYGPVIGAEWHW